MYRKLHGAIMATILECSYIAIIIAIEDSLVADAQEQQFVSNASQHVECLWTLIYQLEGQLREVSECAFHLQVLYNL